MCNILVLEPGQMIPKQKFINMCYNNWHAWGLVTKIDGTLDIQRHVPENGEIDPEEVWKAVEKDIDHQRFLHVRHMTAGTNDIENCHPFDVYYDPKSGRQVVFMHNGTLYDYKSKKPGATGYAMVDDDSGPSDTKNFVDRILTPYVAQADFGNGIADLTAFPLKLLLAKFWASSNRGILISSDQDFLLLGRHEWKEIKAVDDSSVWSANDLYFDNVTRGPEHDRREKAEQERLRLENEKRAQEVLSKGKETSSSHPEIVKLSDVRTRGRHPFFDLSEGVSNILNDWDFYGDDREGRSALAYLTDAELEDLYKEKDTMIWVFNFLAQDYAVMHDEMTILQDKKEKAELVIAAMKKKIKELTGELKGSEKAVQNDLEGKAA